MQKKYKAYSMMSGNEEIAVKLQETTKELAEAQETLEETMYDKYISDTQDILDDMLNELETFVNEIYQNIDELFRDGVTTVTGSTDEINNTLIELSASYGTAFSGLSTAISNIWANGYNFADGFSEITSRLDSLIAESDAQADKVADTSVYDTVKGKYTDLDSYDKAIQKAQESYMSEQSTEEFIAKDLESAKTKRDEAKDYRAYIKEKYGKDSTEYDKANKKYQTANNTYNSIAEMLKRQQRKTSEAESSVFKAEVDYNVVKNGNYHLVKDFLSKIVNSKPTHEGDLTELENKVLEITGGYIADYNKPQLAELLGVKNNESSILGELKRIGFRTGGIATVDSGILRKTGEDGWVLARNGEGFVSPENVQDIRNLMQFAPDMSKFLTNLTIPNYDNIVPNRNLGVGDVNLSFGDIKIDGINDPGDFGRRLRDEICSNGRTTKCITEAVTAQMSGNGIGKARMWK